MINRVQFHVCSGSSFESTELFTHPHVGTNRTLPHVLDHDIAFFPAVQNGLIIPKFKYHFQAENYPKMSLQNNTYY